LESIADQVEKHARDVFSDDLDLGETIGYVEVHLGSELFVVDADGNLRDPAGTYPDWSSGIGGWHRRSSNETKLGNNYL
jgi:hypothetical protein